MQKKLLSLMTFGMVLIGMATLAPSASAASILPKPLEDLLDAIDPGKSASYVTARVAFALYLMLGGVILVAVVYAIMAAYKYIQSQGDPGKIGEAQKAIKAIFFGVGALAVGVVGIVLVTVFFDFDLVDPDLPQVCISAAESDGCRSCIDDGKDAALCMQCEREWTDGTPDTAACGL
jgi:hypothetical protein